MENTEADVIFYGEKTDDLLGESFDQTIRESDRGHAIILKGRKNWPREIDLDIDTDYWYFKSNLSNFFYGVGINFLHFNDDLSFDIFVR